MSFDINRLVSQSMRVEPGPSAAEAALVLPVLAALRAGLRGDVLPKVTPSGKEGHMALINAVYDEARNWQAGQRARVL